MKNSLFIFLASSLFSMSSMAAIWRVNNITGVDADFTDLTSAVAAASTGDTIYIEPGTTAVSGASINKKLTIIGNGYFLSSPASAISTVNPGLQANAVSSSVTGITFSPGSEFSTIMGLNITSDVYIYVSNITVKRCYVGGYVRLSNYQNGNYVSTTNIDIRQNIIISGLIAYQFSTNSGTVGITNVNVQNNIFSTYYYNQVQLPVGVSGFMMNNTFYSPYYYLDVYSFQLNNNYMFSGGNFNANNNVYFNNIAGNSAFGTSNNNQQNVASTSIFLYSTSADSSFILNPSGPGVGAGFGGVDIGPYGGTDPYRRSGIPPVPAIYMLSAPATTTTSTLPVTISTRSNN